MAYVGRIVARVVASAQQQRDLFDGLCRIGIDEISYKRGHRYLTVVVDRDSGRLVWAAPGRDSKTVQRFFDLLGPERCARITEVSADGAAWIAKVVATACPNATLCVDPFHVVSWASDALDEIRREVWNAARRQGQKAVASELKAARFALWKNPEHLTERQRATLAEIAKTNRPLYRAYLLKEQLRQVFHPARRRAALARSLARLGAPLPPQALRRAGKTIQARLPGIRAAVTRGLSNGRVEAVNTKVRLLTRVAFGFRSPEALIALALLNLGGFYPPLPGRS